MPELIRTSSLPFTLDLMLPLVVVPCFIHRGSNHPTALSYVSGTIGRTKKQHHRPMEEAKTVVGRVAEEWRSSSRGYSAGANLRICFSRQRRQYPSRSRLCLAASSALCYVGVPLGLLVGSSIFAAVSIENQSAGAFHPEGLYLCGRAIPVYASVDPIHRPSRPGFTHPRDPLISFLSRPLTATFLPLPPVRVPSTISDDLDDHGHSVPILCDVVLPIDISAHSAGLRPLEEYEHDSDSARAHVPPQKRVPRAAESAVSAPRSLCPARMPLLGLSTGTVDTSFASISCHLPARHLPFVPIESRRRISMDNNWRTAPQGSRPYPVTLMRTTHVPKAPPPRPSHPRLRAAWAARWGERDVAGRMTNRLGAGDAVSRGVVLWDMPPPLLSTLEFLSRSCRLVPALGNARFRDSRMCVGSIPSPPTWRLAGSKSFGIGDRSHQGDGETERIGSGTSLARSERTRRLGRAAFFVPPHSTPHTLDGSPPSKPSYRRSSSPSSADRPAALHLLASSRPSHVSLIPSASPPRVQGTNSTPGAPEEGMHRLPTVGDYDDDLRPLDDVMACVESAAEACALCDPRTPLRALRRWAQPLDFTLSLAPFAYGSLCSPSAYSSSRLYPPNLARAYFHCSFALPRFTPCSGLESPGQASPAPRPVMLQIRVEHHIPLHDYCSDSPAVNTAGPVPALLFHPSLLVAFYSCGAADAAREAWTHDKRERGCLRDAVVWDGASSGWESAITRICTSGTRANHGLILDLPCLGGSKTVRIENEMKRRRLGYFPSTHIKQVLRLVGPALARARPTLDAVDGSPSTADRLLPPPPIDQPLSSPRSHRVSRIFLILSASLQATNPSPRAVWISARRSPRWRRRCSRPAQIPRTTRPRLPVRSSHKIEDWQHGLDTGDVDADVDSGVYLNIPPLYIADIPFASPSLSPFSASSSPSKRSQAPEALKPDTLEACEAPIPLLVFGLAVLGEGCTEDAHGHAACIPLPLPVPLPKCGV
ncbi:hypothetical protein MSAN_01742200 [Mycena sanguinolenta]|uniref:Uncharacterized protein n=1 Tax=Mycena sanguinolenta TaxID=230812 RepID=A0A8H6XWI2_9AGAR|nr:hypothetical protein MSAN_01742200 [Mycena sanguinolenta]